MGDEAFDRLRSHDALGGAAVEQALGRVERSLARRRRRRQVARTVAAVGAVGLAAAAVAVALSGGGVPALRHQSGERLRAVVEGEIDLSDGSRIEVDADSLLRWRRNRGGVASLELARGRARFDIAPGGPRAWSIRAGPLTVRVLGTAFTVEREGPRSAVAVHRGSVEVRTEGEGRRLYAGERFEVGSPPRAPSAPERAVPAAPEGPDPAEAASPPGTPPATPAVVHEAQAPARPPPRTSAAPPPARPSPGPSPPTAGADEAAARQALLARADEERRAGRLDEALEALEAFGQAYPDAPEASSAAVSRGRLHEARGELEDALAAYRDALRLAPSPALAELTYERLVVLEVRAGRPARAYEAAEDYRRRFPDGDRRSAIDEALP
ncbi:MAG: FecR domain-containing protein [Sandaracinaceae bacterium]